MNYYSFSFPFSIMNSKYNIPNSNVFYQNIIYLFLLLPASVPIVVPHS